MVFSRSKKGSVAKTKQVKWASSVDAKKSSVTSQNKKNNRSRRERVALVFQADSFEGQMIVHALLKSGCRVAAITKSLHCENVGILLKQGRVTVKVFNTTDRVALAKAIRGADRAILVTKYWERFESPAEEEQAMALIEACHVTGIKDLLFTSLEDTKKLRKQGLKSQITANEDGEIYPTFKDMMPAKKKALDRQIHLNHMITSYVDTEISKTSLCLISGENGKLIVKPFYEENQGRSRVKNLMHTTRSIEDSSASVQSSAAYSRVPRKSRISHHNSGTWDFLSGILPTLVMAILTAVWHLCGRLQLKKTNVMAAVAVTVCVALSLIPFQHWLDQHCELQCKSMEAVQTFSRPSVFFL